MYHLILLDNHHQEGTTTMVGIATTDLVIADKNFLGTQEVEAKYHLDIQVVPIPSNEVVPITSNEVVPIRSNEVV
jgi:hypothetical protein